MESPTRVASRPPPIFLNKKKVQLFQTLVPLKSTPLRSGTGFLHARRLDVRSFCNVSTPVRRASWIHSYPAKMLGEIAGSIILSLEKNAGTKRTPTMVDPMCGSGTTLLYGLCAGWSVRGYDLNPLASLISRVKITRYDNKGLAIWINRLRKATRAVQKQDLKELKDGAEFVALRYWFWPSVLDEIARFRLATDAMPLPKKYRNFLLLAASSSIRPVSKADPDVVPPTISKRRRKDLGTGRPKSFLACFDAHAERIKCALSHPLIRGLRRHDSGVGQSDARKLVVENDSVDYVIMSPPYFTAHDYVRSVRLEMLALGIWSIEDLRAIRANTIGSAGIYGDHASSLGLPTCDSIIEDVRQRQEQRASMLCHYLLQMKDVLTECKRVLKPEGKLVIVIGDSTSQGLTIPTAKLITELCTSVGMQLDSVPVVNQIRSRGFMTRRNVTASVIEDEWILRFANF